MSYLKGDFPPPPESTDFGFNMRIVGHYLHLGMLVKKLIIKLQIFLIHFWDHAECYSELPRILIHCTVTESRDLFQAFCAFLHSLSIVGNETQLENTRGQKFLAATT